MQGNGCRDRGLRRYRVMRNAADLARQPCGNKFGLPELLLLTLAYEQLRRKVFCHDIQDIRRHRGGSHYLH
jgi:hypothetical protein